MGPQSDALTDCPIRGSSIDSLRMGLVALVVAEEWPRPSTWCNFTASF